jgi:hypothetical protein
MKIEALIERFSSLDEAGCEAAAVALGQQGPPGLALLGELVNRTEVDLRFWQAESHKNELAGIYEMEHDPNTLE